MIVLASDNPVLVDSVSTLLKQRGDLFTVAADDTLALSAVRADQASLLIVDANSSGFDGFALCRTIREDASLGGLPVLYLLEPLELTDLLRILDSSADGFLSGPFDLASLSSAVDDLKEPVPAPAAHGSLRTQFRITHEGKDYTVSADRRTLLSFLLTAFEGTVRVRKDQGRMRTELMEEIREIRERLGTLTAERDATVKNLHDELEERGRAISRMNATLLSHEQAEALLKTQKENVALELKDLGAVLEETRKSDEEKGELIASLNARVEALKEESARSDREAAATIRDLEERCRELTGELGSARSSYASLKTTTTEVERALSDQKRENAQNGARILSLEGELQEISKAHLSAQDECRSLNETLRQTRDAADAKEQEVRSALDNLTAGLRSLEGALEQNLRNLEKELALRRELELQVESLTKERDRLAQAGDETATKLAATNAEVAAERDARIRIQTECDAIGAERERLQEVLNTTYRNQASLEKKLTDMGAPGAASPPYEESADLRRQIEQLKEDLHLAQTSLAEERGKRALAENRYVEQELSGENTRKFLDSAARDIGILNAAVAEERERRKTAEDHLLAREEELADKNRDIASLRQELEAVRSAAKERGPIIVGPQDPPLIPSFPPVEIPKDPGISRLPDPPHLSGSDEESFPDPAPPQDAARERHAEQDLLPVPAPSFQMTLPASGEGVQAKNPPAEPAQETDAPEKDQSAASPAPSRIAHGDLIISRDRWLDITKWAHHTTAVTEEQRKDLIASLMRLSKLVQKGRHLTNRQEQEIRALLSRVQALGYRFV